MGALETKRDAIYHQVTGQAPSAGGGLLQVILQILKSLLGGLGGGGCGLPVPTIHNVLTNPTPFHQRVLKNTTRRELRRAGLPSSLELPIVEATLSVGAKTSETETQQMVSEIAS